MDCTTMAGDIRDRVMSMPSTDVREEVAKLCDIVGALSARVDRLERAAEAQRKLEERFPGCGNSGEDS